MKNLLLLLLFYSFSFCSFGQIKQSQAIDNIFSEWNKHDVPGGSFGIVKDGELIYTKGYGIADLEHGVEITPSTLFDIGSIAKYFTAVCILLLEEQGKLSLDDRIQKFLPDFPEYEANITIRHLLDHTHGIREYGSLKNLKGISGFNYTKSDVSYELIKRQKGLNCLPGEEFIYGNSGYFLLGKIVESASGQSLRIFAQEQIFGPLGMNNTHFHDNNKDVIKNHASSYSPKYGTDGFNNLITRSVGGVKTNVKDLAIWDHNFYHNKLGKGDKLFIQKMQEEGLLTNGESTGHSLGLQKGSYRGLKIVESNGSFAGYLARILRFPDENFSVIILANRADADPRVKSFQVSDILLKDKFASVSEKEEAKTDSPTNTKTSTSFALNQLVGDYEVVPGRVAEITVKGDMLHVLQKWDGAAFPVINTVGNSYQIPNTSIMELVFSEMESGYAQRLSATLNGVEFLFKRKEKLDLPPLNLNDFLGSYYSSEIDASFLIFEEDEELQLKIAHYEPTKLSIYDFHNDALFFDDGLLRFNRSKGSITGFEFDNGRVNNLKFKKM
ncbi:MAG: beta-lactamase family protein [Saprospiraceae bacterium]|nr:beta-lactamase family protein [Bacteroidia bacterium]NNE15482.1 beta-lactamase family protein [Saprospiraceae bacterium]NNL92053.1 beta-lactamase family protein [Saprospiraceae bacterium]